jgi:hypothetical protein
MRYYIENGGEAAYAIHHGEEYAFKKYEGKEPFRVEFGRDQGYDEHLYGKEITKEEFDSF